MIRWPLMPEPFARRISGMEEQSAPQFISPSTRRTAGVGSAFTAKYSRKPGFHEKASLTVRTVSRIPASS